LPRKRGEPVFQDSWEAEAYAMGNILVKQGVVSCRKWMDLMTEAIRKAQLAGDPDAGDTYYLHWCDALETLCFQMGLISRESYQELLDLWAQAIANTPHGVALAIENAASGSQGGPHDHAHSHDHGHSHAHGHGSDHPPTHYWTPIHVTQLNPNPSEG
jgi:nitrile hydratase accessory protein